VRVDHVHPVVVFGKAGTAVDEQDPARLLESHAVHAHLPESAERQQTNFSWDQGTHIYASTLSDPGAYGPGMKSASRAGHLHQRPRAAPRARASANREAL